MKTLINASGRMVISPDTELEAYALCKWWEDWIAKKAVLQLDLIEKADGSQITFRSELIEIG